MDSTGTDWFEVGKLGHPLKIHSVRKDGEGDYQMRVLGS